jgi:hypothetical protein
MIVRMNECNENATTKVATIDPMKIKAATSRVASNIFWLGCAKRVVRINQKCEK